MDVEALRIAMEDAAARGDFERAAEFRDRISILRGLGTTASAEDIDLSGLTRQTPGRMGLGTSRQRIVPPAGWQRPPKPDPMTQGRTKSRGRRRPSD